MKMAAAAIAISVAIIINCGGTAFAGGIETVRPGSGVDLTVPSIPKPVETLMVPPPLPPVEPAEQCKWHDEYKDVWDNSTIPPRLIREKTTVCDR
jgi:hypothetical protein